MGRPKLTLPLGTGTVITAVIDALRNGGVDKTLVVVGPNAEELRTTATAAGADVCVLPSDTDEMRFSVEHGLRWFEANDRPAADDAWFLIPGDHPAVEVETIQRLIHARHELPGSSIWLPTYGGRRGHPALISWRHVTGIRELSSGNGINFYLRQHAHEVAEIPVTTESILFDLDLPADYEALARRVSHGADSDS